MTALVTVGITMVVFITSFLPLLVQCYKFLERLSLLLLLMMMMMMMMMMMLMMFGLWTL